MPAPNVLLVKFAGGIREIDHSGGGDRVESFVQWGNLETIEEVDDLAALVLPVLAATDSTIAIRPVPRSSPLGFVGYNLLSTVNGQRVMAISLTTDDEGRATTTPELISPVALRKAAIEREIRRRTDSADGASETGVASASKRPGAKPPRPARLPVFSADLSLPTLVSPPYPIPYPMVLTYIWVAAEVEGSGPLIVDLWDQDSAIASVTLNPGDGGVTSTGIVCKAFPMFPVALSPTQAVHPKFNPSTAIDWEGVAVVVMTSST